MSQLFIGFLLSVLAVIFFAIVNILVGRSLSSDKLVEGIYITIIFSTLIIFVFTILTGELFQIFSLSIVVWILFMITGILNFLIARTFNYTGINFLGPSRNAAIVSTRIFFAAFFAFLFLGETLTIPIIIGVSMAFIGVFLVSLSQASKNGHIFKKIGLIFPFLTALFVGLAVIVIRQADILSNLPIDGVFIAYLTATFFYTPGAIYRQVKSKTMYSRKSLIILAIGGVLSGIAQISRYSALQVAPVVLVASIVATVPLGTIIFSFFFNRKHEILNWKLVLGSIITVSVVILISVSLQAI